MASPQCCANPPTLNPAGGEGKVVDSFGGIKSYVAGAAESKAAVILVSDVFGFEAPNLRKIADKVASSGYFVVVPDFLHGDPLVLESTEKPFPVWIKEHGPDKAFEEAKPVIAALKEKGASTVGAVGYCWGAKVVAELAKAHEIQAAVMCHPSFVTVDDIKEVKCPIAILGAEIDRMSPPEVVKQFEQVLSSKSGIGHFVKIFPGVEHGWTVRYKTGRGEVVDSFGGMKAYISGAADSKAAIILISDVYDFFYGDPFVAGIAERLVQVWIEGHWPNKGSFEEAKSIIAALKEKGVSSIGAAGYCWGGKVVVDLAKAHEIQAALMCHPSFVTVDDIKEVKCPIAILAAEVDHMSPVELIKQFEQVLSSMPEVDHLVKIFPGVEHGWTVRYKSDDANAVKRLGSPGRHD
uniref:Dienelactone hydrolase domain-containing protein n=1 Tax=Leersia perrieri TaxID=77586 RepID=A0A0D9WG91_9ORYZ